MKTRVKRIVILSGSPLCTNPRVVKEARTLSDAGYEVTVLGAWLDAAAKEHDEELIARSHIDYRPVLDWTAQHPGGRTGRFWSRLRMKAGQLIHAHAGRENSWQVGYAVSELLKAALQSEGDLFIAHFEQTLVVAEQLLARGCRVAVDMEDWFSEDLLPEMRANRPVKLLRRLEQELLGRAAYATCTSLAMSQALALEYGCPAPAVVYNAFPWTDRQTIDGLVKDRVDLDRPSLHWYSQTLGPGRGIEDLLAALPDVKHEVEIHLRGNVTRGFEDWLASHTPESWKKRIFIHGLVSNSELLSRIAEHDIGFAGEMKYCRSRDLTVTNKILQYLLGGLAVVASDTAGQREIASQSGSAVSLYHTGDPVALARALDGLLGNTERLERAKSDALQAAEREFCWEQQAPKLLESVEAARA